MKTIEVDEDLYRYIASQTQDIGESASQILRRILQVQQSVGQVQPVTLVEEVTNDQAPLFVALKKTSKNAVAKEFKKPTAMNPAKEMRSLLNSTEFTELSKSIDKFMIVLSKLHKIDPASFTKATQVKGRTRVYFAYNEETLLQNGTTTKPKQIPMTPFWVVTNNNTNRKKQMVEQLMVRMDFSTDLIEKIVSAI